MNQLNWLFSLLGLALWLPTALAYGCGTNITSLTGKADLESWIITSANSTSLGNISYCDISATIGGRIGVWMKLPQTWNGRYVQIGCGGACGYNPLESDSTYAGFRLNGTLEAGYALGSTDMGVPNSTDNYGPMAGNLQMRIDWAYLATHLAAVMGRQLIGAAYGSEPVYSYHLGGSTGGRQGLVEAQRYPEDFDGVFAIAPAYNETGVTVYSIASTARATLLDETNFTAAITDAESDLIHSAVLEACDGLDGLEDGIISLPRLCHFDPASLVCPSDGTAAGNTSCISSTALEAARKVYSGPISSLTGARQVPEGLLPGSEQSWQGTYIPSTAGEPSVWYAFAKSLLSHYAFWPDPATPLTPFSVDYGGPALLRQTSKVESLAYGGAADMSKFKLLGGKMVVTQGLQDVAVAPGFARDFWERAGLAMGGGREEFMRFYEMPGVEHVSGGPGADMYDALGIIVGWVEEGVAPDVVVASHLDDGGEVEFTRPLYQYPLVAGYDGTGDVDSWESFVPVNGSAPYWDL